MVDIVSCPSCQRQVSIPTEFFGKLVQCPECKQSFLAQDPSAGAYHQGAPRAESAPRPPMSDDWDEPVERGSGRSRRRYEDDSYDDIGVRRSSMPHRGAAVLTLGILSIVICGPIFGPIAWIMGHNDMKQIRAGYMDPSGEGTTQAGMIIGMVMTILSGAILSIYCLIAMMAAAGGAFR